MSFTLISLINLHLFQPKKRSSKVTQHFLQIQIVSKHTLKRLKLFKPELHSLPRSNLSKQMFARYERANFVVLEIKAPTHFREEAVITRKADATCAQIFVRHIRIFEKVSDNGGLKVGYSRLGTN